MNCACLKWSKTTNTTSFLFFFFFNKKDIHSFVVAFVAFYSTQLEGNRKHWYQTVPKQYVQGCFTAAEEGNKCEHQYILLMCL